MGFGFAASAQTTNVQALIAQLQAQIAQLMAQLKALQTQQGTATATKTATPSPTSTPTQTTSSSLPISWDWRNVNGENWMSPVKSQGDAGTCFIFGKVGVFEAQINLYYNQHLDLNLSEQMRSDCIQGIQPGGYISAPQCANYNCAPANNYCNEVYSGIADEQCDPYVSDYPNAANCNSSHICSDWNSRTWKASNFYDYIYGSWNQNPNCPQTVTNFSDDNIKKIIIQKGPAYVRVDPWSHGMVLTGYKSNKSDWKTTQYCIPGQEFCIPSQGCVPRACQNIGQTITTCVNDYEFYNNGDVKSGIYTYTCQGSNGVGYYTLTNSTSCDSGQICSNNKCVNSTSSKPNIGQIECTKYFSIFDAGYFDGLVKYAPGAGDTNWIFKNSWGTSYGDSGYATLPLPATAIKELSVPMGPFTPPTNKTYWPAGFDGTVKCVDKDNDGYCNWGISDQPPAGTICPTSCKKDAQGKYIKDCNDSNPNQGPFDANYNCIAISPPSITITSPNGGEQWQIGSPQKITWTTINVPSTNNMIVKLRDNAGVDHYIYGTSDVSNTVPNYGFFSITVPSTLSPGQYKMVVKTSINGQSYSDDSDHYFTIAASVACSPNWTCGAWTNCSNGKQTRICNDSNNCGTVTGQPLLTQSCTVSNCVPNWNCTNWSSCINSNQTRTCTDLNSCNSNSGKPTENQSCVYSCSDTDSGIDYNNYGVVTFGGNSYSDWCSTNGGNGGQVSSCSGSNCTLIEQFCDSSIGGVNYKSYVCPNGCANGACNANQAITCTDSDGGENYYVKGTLTGMYNGAPISLNDFCIDRTSGALVGQCSGSSCQVGERVCNSSNPTDYGTKYYTCSNGCSDGACIQQSSLNTTQNSLASISAALSEILKQVLQILAK